MDSTTINTIITGLLAILATSVATFLNFKLNRIAVVVDATHKLTNSAMGALLLTYVTLAEKVADDTGKLSDRQVAIEARKKYNEHEKAQASVDRDNPDGVKPAA